MPYLFGYSAMTIYAFIESKHAHSPSYAASNPIVGIRKSNSILV